MRTFIHKKTEACLPESQALKTDIDSVNNLLRVIEVFQRRLLTITMVFLIVIANTFQASAQSQTSEEDYEIGRIYVKLKDDAPCQFRTRNTERLAIENLPCLVPLKETYNIQALSSPFYFSKSDKLSRTFEVTFSNTDKVMDLIQELEKDPTIEYAERIPVHHLHYTPNDPLYSSNNMWHLFKIRAGEAWDIGRGDPNIVVAIVDGAISVEHSDLKPVIWSNADEIAGNGIDDDNNGFVDDYRGWDFGNSDNDPSPESTSGNNWNHGSHTAGIAGAATDNNNGIASIGAGVSIMPLKTGYECGGVCLRNTTQAITYAAENGANVISMSFGSTNSSTTDQNAITNAYNNGVVLVASAGNSGGQTSNYPAMYSEVIAVANTTENDTKNSGSTYGTWVDVSAPGTNIYSTGYPSSYYNNTGTSMSAPLVSGLAGLLLSINPNLTPAQVKQCITSTAVNIDNLNPSYAGKLGSGRIDARAAAECAAQGTQPTANFTSSMNNCDGTVTFTDISTSATSWSWNFGDGGTSSQADPTHTYSSAGTYTVTLTVTNSNGTDVKTASITVNILTAPTVQGDQVCEGTQASLTASGSGSGASYNWYDAATGGNLIFSGTNYAPTPTTTTTYYVSALNTVSPQDMEPQANSIGGGGYFTANSDHGLFFDALAKFTLKSVKVYANTAGNRTIEVLDGQGGNVLHSKTVDIPAGDSRVTLDFVIEPGHGMFIKVSGNTVDLYRNSDGASFPYTLNDIVSITGTSASANTYYYYFYNWEVQGFGCESARTPVTADVFNVPAATITSGTSVLSCDQSGYTYQWYLNAGLISGATNISYSPSQAGYYQVSIEDGNGCSSLSDSVYWAPVGVPNTPSEASFRLFPNPNHGQFTLSFGDHASGTWELTLVDMIGQTIMHRQIYIIPQSSMNIELPGIEKGIYFINIKSEQWSLMKQVVVE
ncbi:MAG: S8 family serine peptidase [Flavobacteriales bacterium]|nr:S8 family serine peptidase [Flavobacteriales bacterium]